MTVYSACSYLVFNSVLCEEIKLYLSVCDKCTVGRL